MGRIFNFDVFHWPGLLTQVSILFLLFIYFFLVELRWELRFFPTFLIDIIIFLNIYIFL